MRLILLAIGLLLFGCLLPIGEKNLTNTTPPVNKTIPPGYEVQDYCEKDSDCVRLNSCCDCGDGVYVNTYHQQNVECDGHRCMCPIRDTVGKCEKNKCIAVSQNETGNGKPETGFCGWSTNATCSTDADCTTGGCSGQVCQSKSEKSVITTCEYTECYDSARYGVTCGCDSGKCSWK